MYFLLCWHYGCGNVGIIRLCHVREHWRFSGMLFFSFFFLFNSLLKITRGQFRSRNWLSPLDCTRNYIHQRISSPDSEKIQTESKLLAHVDCRFWVSKKKLYYILYLILRQFYTIISTLNNKPKHHTLKT